MIIPFDPPLKLSGGGTVNELRLREPTGQEIWDAEKALAARATTPLAITLYSIALIGAVAGIAAESRDEAINAMPAADFRRACDFLQAFDEVVPTQNAVRGETLSIPVDVEVGGIAYTSLDLAEPTVGARRKAESVFEAGDTIATRRHYQLILVSQASGMPFPAVCALPVSVLARAEAFLRGFLQGGPTTGEV